MKFSTTSILLAAAISVSAHPGGHAHKHARRSVEGRSDYVIARKPDNAQPAGTVAPPAPVYSVPASTPASSAQPQPSQGSGASASTYQSFCGGQSPTKRATNAQIAYAGNVGTATDYGCNMMLIDQSIASKYQYTVTFTNAASDEQACVCWNKIGHDGRIDGFFKGNEAVSFSLAVGGTQVLAVDANSQGGCSCGSGSVPTTSFGQFASSWVEFDFADSANNNWSGADASCLVAAANNLEIPGLQVCCAGTCSTINNGGTGTNAYLAGMENQDGVGLNLAPGNVALTVAVGYQG